MDGRNINILLSSCLAAAAAVVVLSASATRPTDRVRVELKPRDVLIATGENLTVNCTLSRAGYGSSNDLFFRVNNSLLNASLEVEVISERAAALRVTNVQRNMSGVVECHHRSLGVTPDTTHVLVADKPTKPRIRECIVHNWENMSCFWDEPEETGIETNITVCFMLVHMDRSECHPCPNPDRAGRHSCSLLKEDRRIRFLKIRYWVLIEAENKLGWDYDLIVQDPAEHPIVKPNGVQSLECVANSSQSCVALWGSPAEGEKLNYRIKFQIQNSEFKSRWDAEELVARTNVTYVTLSNLIPSTEYQLIIDCIPLINGIEWGIWSPPELCSCRTHTDVPAMNPPVTFGAYRVLPADGHSNRRRGRPVQLHWQPVPRRWSNGEITEVRVRITKQLDFPSKQHLGVTAPRNAGRLGTSVSAAGRDLTLPGSVTNATVDLDVDSTYIWTVEARTSSGYNESLLPLSVVIPKKDETPRFPKRFVVATDSTNHYYTFIDASTFPDASGYTIYWCTTSGNRPDICSSPYNWTHIRPLQAEHELHLPNHPCPSVRFQVSLEYLLPSGETVSSGMLAVDSIYSRDGVLRIPENLRFSEGAKDSESLTIRWNIDRSSYCTNSAYISHYVIRYCSTRCHETSVEGSVDVAKLTDLQPGTVYRIQLKSCSIKNQESDFTEAIVDTTSTQDSQWDKIIFAVSTATGGLVLVCLLLLCRQLKQRTRRSILIVIPKKCSLPAVEIENDGYRTPVLPITNFDPYLHPCNGALSAENSQPTRDTYPTWMTIEPGNLSSHISVPHINSPNDNSSSSSVEYSPIQYNASMCLRVLPDLCSSETQR